MPAPKKTQSEDVGAEQVQSARDEARAKGYEGYSPSTIPNKEYTLLTGPDSPSQAEMAEAIAEQRFNDQKGS